MQNFQKQQDSKCRFKISYVILFTRNEKKNKKAFQHQFRHTYVKIGGASYWIPPHNPLISIEATSHTRWKSNFGKNIFVLGIPSSSHDPISKENQTRNFKNNTTSNKTRFTIVDVRPLDKIFCNLSLEKIKAFQSGCMSCVGRS